LQRLKQYVADHPEWKGNEDLLVDPPSNKDALGDYPELEGSDVLGRVAKSGVPSLLLYYISRRNGSTHKFAEMCACQAPPGCMTDSVFFADRPKLCDQFASDVQFKKVLGIARKHGYIPNANDVYTPGIARFQGDPQAFCTTNWRQGLYQEAM